MLPVFLHDLFYIICRQKYFCRNGGVEAIIRFLACWHGAYAEYLSDDIIIRAPKVTARVDEAQIKSPRSGAPVFINKHHLVFFSAGDKISSHWGE